MRPARRFQPYTEDEKEKRKGSPRDLLRLIAYARPYKTRLAIAFTSLVIASGAALAFPQLVRVIIDAAFIEKNADRLNSAALTLIALFATQAAFSFLRTYLLSYTGERIVADVRAQVYTHLISLPVSFFASRRVGELTSRLASDVTVIQTVTTGTLTELLRNTIVLVGGIVIIAITNTRLTLVMMGIVPLVILMARFYGRYIQRLSTRVQDRLAEANSVLEESISAIRIVQSFVREEYERNRYRQKIADALQMAVKRSLATGGFIAFIILVVYSGIVVVLWVGSRLVVSGGLTAGDLIAFVLYTFVVAGSIGGMSELYGQFNQAIGATRRVFELLDTRPEITDAENAEPLEQVRGHVQLIDAHFSYPDERNLPVLRGVSIDAEAGEIIALVGPSGAGKSTLINLIPRFYDVTEGALLVDGRDVRAVKLADLRQAIGMVPQETILFGGTIRENIAYGKLDA
ncbi:MAG TPA: ABC transporter transmembrane domain-containing protein, partial [Blastocatellia bacterium]